MSTHVARAPSASGAAGPLGPAGKAPGATTRINRRNTPWARYNAAQGLTAQHIKGERMKKITVAILTSWDLARLERGIISALRQSVECAVFVEINTADKSYHKAAQKICRDYRVPAYVSDRSGTAGLGKQAVFDRFKELGGEYLYILDGDDWLYPTAIEALTKVINKAKPDILTHCIADRVSSPGTDSFRTFPQFLAEFGINCEVWGDVRLREPEKDLTAAWLWEEEVIHNAIGLVNFFSKKATETFRWHESLGCFEDTLLLLQSLPLSREREIKSYLSMSQSIFIVDRTGDHRTSERCNLAKASNDLRKEAAKFLEPGDGSIWELPTVGVPYMMPYEQKVNFVRRSYYINEAAYPQFHPKTTPEGVQQ